MTSGQAQAVVLGGGGPVGRAWQTGLAAGWERLGVSLGAADLVIGSSAGAIVGAEIALHLGLAAVAAEFAATGGPATPSDPP